jgi:ABC-type Fe3+-hydroxamate transport system substrate-binding protein
MILNVNSVIDFIPKKIISLVPSQTELLFSLGLDKEVIGITKFCIHPKTWFTTKTRIGGTKNIDIDKINLLQPDFIIANKEENTKTEIELLAKKYPVLVTDIIHFEDAMEMIAAIGKYTNKSAFANEIVQMIRQSFSSLKPFSKPQKKAAYLIWKNPYMTVGQDTFINDILNKIGFSNCFQHSTRYPTITMNDIVKQDPDCIFLSSEPYPFKEKDIKELRDNLPKCNIILVDGEMFSWYGSRLTHAPSYFSQLLEKC